MTKLKNSNSDQTKNLKCDKTKNQIVTKLKIPKCYKTQIVTKLKKIKTVPDKTQKLKL